MPFLKRAVAIDPDFALGHAWLALALTITFVLEMNKRYLDEASAAAQRALVLDGSDATAHWASAMVMMWSGLYDQAGSHFDRAIALNPADIQIRADRANLLRYSGRFGEALAAIDDALKQGAFAPHWFWQVRGEILFDLKRYGEAVAAFDNLPEKGLMAHIYLAAAHVYLGDEANATKAVSAARQFRPGLRVRDLNIVKPHANRTALDHLLEGLRKAALPE